MGWVDSHCHLQLDGRPAEELLGRADGVDWLVVPGVDAESSEAARRVANAHPARVRWTAGLHPHQAEEWPTEGDRIAALATDAHAVGETGLDYYRMLAPKDAQLEAFRAQVALAADLDLPLVVHCRDAFSDTHEILERSGAGPRAVLHCWTGGPRWSRRFLDLGVTFSFAGPVAFPTGDTVRRGAEVVPPERSLVETDTPYLTPPPHRGEPNEPAWVALVGAALADVWSVDAAEVMRVTSDRAGRVFGRPDADG